MDKQRQAALEDMKNWLSHPGELGREPARIELADEFELHDLHYYIFKYKKTVLGKWLLGVCGGYEPGGTEHCGHVFSEMEPYNPGNAREKAAAMVEMIRQYWMDRAEEALQKRETKKGEAGGDNIEPADKENTEPDGEEIPGVGSFLGFVLLSEPVWDVPRLKADLKTDWDIDWTEEEKEDADEEDDGTAFVFSVGEMMAAVTLIDAPVPEEEAVGNAANNYMWPEAVEVTRTHRAQILVAVLGQDSPVMERGKLLVKLLAACCRQEKTLGIYTSGTVFQPSFYLDASQMLADGELPLLNWIYFGLYQQEMGWGAYTYGLRMLGKQEIEILPTKAGPEELREFLLDIAYYVLEEDAVLRDGETIGFTEQQKLPVTYGKGAALDGMTIKIGYKPGR